MADDEDDDTILEASLDYATQRPAEAEAEQLARLQDFYRSFGVEPPATLDGVPRNLDQRMLDAYVTLLRGRNNPTLADRVQTAWTDRQHAFDEEDAFRRGHEGRELTAQEMQQLHAVRHRSEDAHEDFERVLAEALAFIRTLREDGR